MAPLPSTDAGAGIAFYLVLGTFALLEARVRLRSQLNRTGTRSDRGSRALIYGSVMTGIVGGFALAGSVHAAAIPRARWPIFVLGVLLMVAGILIRQWAVALLGRFFTTDVRVHPDQRIVDAGPYRWVRHPSYTGMIITMLGIGLALGNWAALATLAAVPTVGLVVRIRVEERALIEALGEPYRRFAAGRPHLFPGLW